MPCWIRSDVTVDELMAAAYVARFISSKEGETDFKAYELEYDLTQGLMQEFAEVSGRFSYEEVSTPDGVVLMLVTDNFNWEEYTKVNEDDPEDEEEELEDEEEELENEDSIDIHEREEIDNC